MTITIRNAEYGDMKLIERVFREGLEKARYPYPPYEMSHLMHLMVEQIKQGLMFVSIEDVDGRRFLTGVAVIDTANWPWAPEPEHTFLSNQHLIVLERFRAGAAGEMLLDAMLDFAARKNMTFLLQFTHGTLDLAVLDRWLKSKGGYPVGVNFVFPAKHPEDQTAH